MSWSRFFRRSRWDDERAAELEAHLTHEIDDNIARGMTPEAARTAAHRKLGNATRIREDIFHMNTIGPLDTLWRDLRYGMRLLVKNRTLSIIAILTLALGTGANAAIFQLFNALRLRSLAVERPEELVSIGIDRRGTGRVGRGYSGRSIHTEPLWEALRAEQQAFSSIMAWSSGAWDLASEGETRLARGFYVSGSYFQTLGVRPHLGRLLNDADDQKGCGAPAAVLSHAFWQTRYGGDPAVIGQAIALERRPFQIVGVAPPHFSGVEVGRTFDLMVPLCAEPMIRPRPERNVVWWLDIMGRLEPGWTPERARAHLEALSPAIFKATVPPTYNAQNAQNYLANRFTVEPAPTGVSDLRTAYETPLWLLLGATALVLLITCANLANLMLARASAREREIAVRLAIGASRGRIVRQLLSESLLLALAGTAGGLLLAQWLSRLLVAFLSTRDTRIFVDLTPDWRVFALMTVVAIASCLVFGLSPALKATRTAPIRAMSAGGRSSTDGTEALTLRRALVIVQVTLSIVLVVGALLFARTLRNLTTVDVGFRTEGIVEVTVDVSRANVQPAALHPVYQQVLQRVGGVPGVQLAAEAMIVPLGGAEWNGRIVVDGELKQSMTYFNQVGPDFFRTLDMPLVEGRTFGAIDRPGAPLAAIVSETFVRQFLGGGSPIARTFQDEPFPGAPPRVYHVVGVVKDTRSRGLRQPPAPMAYLAWSQEPQPPPFLQLLVRSELPLAALTPSLTRAVLQAAPGAAVQYNTLSAYLRDGLVTERVMTALSGFFAVLATIIASIGLYGVLSYMVARRKVEIGIRIALGADVGTVIRMVLRELGVLLASGLVAGIALAWLATRYAEGLLFGLEPFDPASFVLATGLLAMVSLAAAWLPARRASRLDPTIAFREQ